MKLHESPQDFKDLIEVTAQHFSMRPVFVEKDYWVTYVLKNLANSQHADKVVFKGGTSLSKAYGYIERFSEDIDLAIISPGNYSGDKMKALLKKVSADITKGLTLIDGHESEVKFGKNRTTAYKYPRALMDANFGPVKDFILVEINAFTNPVPNQVLPIQTYIAHFLKDQGDQETIEKFDLQLFNINVLAAERTYFEKVFSINRLSYQSIDTLKEKVRHFNDIYRLQINKDLKDKILTSGSYNLMLSVRKDDENNPTMAGPWLNQALSSSPLFADLDNAWAIISPAFEKEIADLSWSKSVPASAEVLKGLNELREFLKQFDDHFPPEKKA